MFSFELQLQTVVKWTVWERTNVFLVRPPQVSEDRTPEAQDDLGFCACVRE